MTIQTTGQRFDDPEEHRRQLANAQRRIIANTRTGRLTFANGTTSTVLTLTGMSASTGHVSLTPTNATGQATAFRATYANNQATFTHLDPGADATYSYVATLTGG